MNGVVSNCAGCGWSSGLSQGARDFAWGVGWGELLFEDVFGWLLIANRADVQYIVLHCTTFISYCKWSRCAARCSVS